MKAPRRSSAAPLARSQAILTRLSQSIETTQIYFDADLELKQRILDLVTPLNGKPERYRPDDKLLAFLRSL
jgi:hypothetical protein